MRESRTRRARRLLLLSLTALRRDPRLLVFPLAAAAAGLLIGALSLAIASGLGGSGHARLVIVLAVLIAGYPAAFASILCSVAMAAVLAGRLDEEGSSIGHGWSFAQERLGELAGWTLLVCTAGAVLRPLEAIVPASRRLSHSVLGLAWTPATLLAVPVLAYEELGPMRTLKRSAELFRRRWDQHPAVAAGTGAGFLLAPFAVIVLVGLAVGGDAGLALAAAGGAAILLLGPVLAALDDVYRLFVYRSALGLGEDGDSPFPRRDLEQPFLGPRGRPSRVRARAV